MGSVNLEALNHVGVRVRDLRRSAEWYAHLGFRLIWQSDQHKVACLRNDEIGVELNLIFNSDDSNGEKNVLMDIEPKYPGFNHLSFRVSSIEDTTRALRAAGIQIREGSGLARRRDRGIRSRPRPQCSRAGRDHLEELSGASRPNQAVGADRLERRWSGRSSLRRRLNGTPLAGNKRRSPMVAIFRRRFALSLAAISCRQ